MEIGNGYGFEQETGNRQQGRGKTMRSRNTKYGIRNNTRMGKSGYCVLQRLVDWFKAGWAGWLGSFVAMAVAIAS